MASRAPSRVIYPTSDGKPMAESDDHRGVMIDTITVADWYFRDDPAVYVSGNLLLFYVEGNKHRHVSPDFFMVRGIPKHRRDNYLLWEEGRGPDCVIELTSPSTRNEDVVKKYELYRDTLRVPEYFLFDPKDQYLKPRLQGHRLLGGRYVPIEPVAGRLPSETLGLHLEGVGTDLRLYDPATGGWLPRAEEIRTELRQTQADLRQTQADLRQTQAARQQADAARQQADAARQQADAARQQADAARQQAEFERQQAEFERQQADARAEGLQRELEELRRKLAGRD